MFFIIRSGGLHRLIASEESSVCEKNSGYVWTIRNNFGSVLPSNITDTVTDFPLQILFLTFISQLTA